MYVPLRSDNPRQLLAQRTCTVLSNLTIRCNYWLKEHVLSFKIWQSPAITGSKNMYCPLRSQIWQSPAITGSKNLYCPLKSDHPRQIYWLKEHVLSFKIWQSPANIGSRNMYCPLKSNNPRQILAQGTCTVRQDLTILGNYRSDSSTVLADSIIPRAGAVQNWDSFIE